MGRLLMVVGVLLAVPVTARAQDSLVIEIGGKRTILRTLAGFPRDTATAAFHSASPRPYAGVHLRQLLEHAGLPAGRPRGPMVAQYILVEAKDGYRVAFGVAELDTALVQRRLVLADSLDGAALPAEEGPWRLIVTGDAHGARSVRMVSAIRVRDP